MALNAAIIKAKLAAASSNTKDNEAQNIINGATAAELKSLDVEACLRLYEALCLLPPRIFSSRDQAAVKKLATETQFQPVKTPDFGVALIKSARPGQNNIQLELSPQLVTRIYAAENKRLSWGERAGFDGDTIGRGQLGQAAYTDVGSPSHFKTELEACMSHVYLSRMLNMPPIFADNFDMSTYKIQPPTNYSIVWPIQALEDFVVAAYLAIRIESATKVGRTSKDAARFAVALYHGMRTMVVAAQTAVNDDVNWAPVEAELRRQGHTDEVDYVNEVVK